MQPRKDGYVIYFQVPKRLRPDGWPPTYKIGHTAHDDLNGIIKRGEELYSELIGKKAGVFKTIPKGSLSDVITLYKKSEHWEVLKPATKKGYHNPLETINKWSKISGYPHIENYQGKHIAAFLNKWKGKHRSRQLHKAILSILFETAIEQGYINNNIVKQIRLPKTKKDKSWKLWEDHDVENFIKCADKMGKWNTGTAVLIAYETAQRMSDVINFQVGRDYKNGRFAFKTSKTGKTINIPVSEWLRKRLTQKPTEQLVLTVHDATGKPWDMNSLGKSFRSVLDKTELTGYQFRKLRNSRAVHSERAGLSSAEFRSIYGWERPDAMLRDYYSDRDQSVADGAIEKLNVMREKFDG